MTQHQTRDLCSKLAETPTADLIDLLTFAAAEIFRRNAAGGFVCGGVFDDGRVIAVGATAGDAFPEALCKLQGVVEEHKSKSPPSN